MTDPSAAPPPPPSSGSGPSTPPPPPSSGPPSGVGPGGGPVQLGLDAPLEVANWRPLVHWLLVIPYAIVTGVLVWALGIVAIVAFFAVLFTKRIPAGLFAFMAMCLRFNWRSMSYQLFLREPYPPFAFESTATDPGDDPASLSIADPGEMNRWLPFVKWLLVIPHLIVLLFLAIGAYLAVFVAFFAVLFTGRWPEGLREYVLGVMRWGVRVGAYVYFMTDEYPPFSLD